MLVRRARAVRVTLEVRVRVGPVKAVGEGLIQAQHRRLRRCRLRCRRRRRRCARSSSRSRLSSARTTVRIFIGVSTSVRAVRARPQHAERRAQGRQRRRARRAQRYRQRDASNALAYRGRGPEARLYLCPFQLPRTAGAPRVPIPGLGTSEVRQPRWPSAPLELTTLLLLALSLSYSSLCPQRTQRRRTPRTTPGHRSARGYFCRHRIFQSPGRAPCHGGVVKGRVATSTTAPALNNSRSHDQ